MRKLFFLLTILFSLSIQLQSKIITDKKFGLYLQLPGDWVSLPTAKNKTRIFDLIKYYPGTDKTKINKKNIQEHVAARIFLQYRDQAPNKKLTGFARQTINLFRITGFEPQASGTLVKTGTRHIHYILSRQPLKQIGKNIDNTLWMSLRFFKMNKKFFLFISMAKSKKELSEGRLIFQTIWRPIEQR